MSSVIPFVVERDGNYERSYDIYSRLLKDRIVFIGDVITPQTARLVGGSAAVSRGQDPKKDINMYIHSPGGSVSAGAGHLLRHHAFIRPTCNLLQGSAASMVRSSSGRRHPGQEENPSPRPVMTTSPAAASAVSQRHRDRSQEILKIRER
jgi:ATP-dependent Clp protease protease subunit